MIVVLLVIAAAIFALLALFGVPGKVNWTAAGLLCLAVVHLFGTRLLA